ncbi:MAG: hypothetical protein QME55_01075 [Brevundimonas sp.]|uniref:hypothetical protein n=1 Tax=Brevundimonas sp. TaxID=1871086 RepID=UPI0026083EF4|nr:hypothetical protein [Brevundimonas sp.]MDI6623296.1 hypothetical protein [Brevundimonas sp.]MDQ7812058.1 hypothetical protein [Brevundimonas sp.]
MPCKADGPRGGYLTIDAMVALAITVLAVAAAVALASNAVSRMAQARDRLTAMRIADDLYEDLYAGERPDGQQAGETGGRSWTYTSTSAGTDEVPSVARRLHIVVDRRFGPDLVVEAVVPPAPVTASLN